MLVFAKNDGNTDDNFAFISNGEIIINGTGIVQMIDLMGHVLITREVNSSLHIPQSLLTCGVYVFRLINGNDVKTQKIVIH